MYDLIETKERYKKLSTEKLLKLAKEFDTLRPEILPVLKQELINRGHAAEAEEIGKEVSPALEDDTYRAICDLVATRLHSGESIDTIKQDLKSQGVDFNELFYQEGDKWEERYKTLTSGTFSGIDEQTLNKILQKEFDDDQTDSQVIKEGNRSKGHTMNVIGTIMLCISVIMYFVGGRVATGFCLTALGAGIGLLYKGIQLSNE